MEFPYKAFSSSILVLRRFTIASCPKGGLRSKHDFLLTWMPENPSYYFILRRSKSRITQGASLFHAKKYPSNMSSYYPQN